MLTGTRSSAAKPPGWYACGMNQEVKMRATISIPDRLFSEAKELAGARAFSDFASEAIQQRVSQLKRERLAREMEEGYRMEAESPSLEPEWANVEVEGL